MKKKLYIIYFNNGESMDFTYIWAKDEDEAHQEYLSERIIDEEDEAHKEDFLSNIYDTFIVYEAVHKDDIKEIINRYLIKPLSK